MARSIIRARAAGRRRRRRRAFAWAAGLVLGAVLALGLVSAGRSLGPRMDGWRQRRAAVAEPAEASVTMYLDAYEIDEHGKRVD